ncbi:MAG: acyl-CoA dehydrogenase family protein [Dehalococcoidia bacterium]|jgi:alkylation response protein AidB-like acyl-CoA dehydrogenase|nr:acyl-CoA dehydrogenase family protein [Dehalococcoidia bacterium]
MDLSLTETQQLLKSGVEDFIARESPRASIIELAETVTGYSSNAWKTAAGIGWLGMAIPEKYGGSGSSLTDLAVVYEALGYGPVPGPFFSSGVLSAHTLLALGDEPQRSEYLPRIASGEIVVAMAITEPDWAWGVDGIQLRIDRRGNSYGLSGTKLFVYDAITADYLITAVRAGDNPGDIGFLIVDTSLPGVSVRRIEGFLTSECEVTFDDVEVPGDALLGGSAAALNGFEAALRHSTPILCAYKVGGAQAVYDMSVEYSRERVQFGQLIGRFQHVQNHIVQLVNHLDSARWTTYEALWKIDEHKGDQDISVHLAKAVTSEGFVQATNYAHEVHAGVGVMREYGLSLFTRLSRSLYHSLGDPEYHRRKLAELVVDYDPALTGESSNGTGR